MNSAESIFVVSDLHIGDSGPRDNFAVGDRREQFNKFLDYVEQQNGEIFIIGDLFEFWQSNFSEVIINNLPLLNRLSDLKTTYIIGNHDADLKAFIKKDFLNHPFFESMKEPFSRTINSRKFKFMHGHEVDPFNKGDKPSWGRMMAIFAGICEDKNGSPFSGDKSIEEILSFIGNLLLYCWQRKANKYAKDKKDKTISLKQELTPSQNPERIKEILELYSKNKKEEGYDALVVGHTHQTGSMGGWYYNTGSWVTSDYSFIEISPSGEAKTCYWRDGQPIPNNKVFDLLSG